MADLLHASFDGSNGATSFTGADGRVWTGTRGAALNTTTKKYGTAALYVAGGDASTSNDSYFLSSGAGPDLGSGDFTIEFWLYALDWFAPALGNGRTILSSYVSTINNAGFTIDSLDGSGTLRFLWQNSNGTGSSITFSAYQVPANAWTHVALVRSGTGTNNLKLYVDGTLRTSGATTATITSAGPLVVGRKYSNTAGGLSSLYGYIDDLRIADTAIYTANFTPTGPASYSPPGLNAASAAAATVTASLGVTKPLAAAPAAVATVVQSVLLGAAPLGATPAGQATLTANLAHGVPLAASAQDVATVTADLTSVFLVNLAAAPAAAATLTAALQTQPLLAASATAVAAGQAAIALAVPLAAQGVATASLTPSLGVSKNLAAASAAVAALSADLGHVVPLQASGAATSSAQAGMSLAVNLAAGAVAQASLAGAMTLSVLMAAIARAQATSLATVRKGVDPAFDVQTRYMTVPAESAGAADDRTMLVPADTRRALVPATLRVVLIGPDAAEAAMPSEAITA